MKKIFTLAMLLVLALTVHAQDTYRKSWDFTKWSATTVANLKAESAKGPTTGAWSDVEKATGTAPTDISKDNCFWEVTAQGNASEGATLMANGEVIPELQGLLYTNTTARSLAIAVNYQVANPSDAAFGPYQGASYLWLGSKTKNYFVIPHVAPGTIIKMGVESHKTSEARGVELYVGIGNSGTKLMDPDGNAVTVPKTYIDQEWLLPEDLTDTPNEDGTFNVTIRNTNGCHIYYITVGDGDAPAVEEAKKVAYLTPADADLDADFAYIFLSGSEAIELTQVDVATATLESLADYEAAVVAPSVTAADADKVKALIAFFPVVNLSSDIYEAMGYGKPVTTEATALTIADATDAIFEGIEELAYDDVITAIELDEYFKDDAVLATAGDKTAIHTHNPGRNAYYFIPTANANPEGAVFQTLIPQTVLAAAKTKRAVTAVSTPVITTAFDNGSTTVTIAAANSKAIYYTTDGTDPTTASTLYSEPFALTEAATVKAMATGDGYTDSQIAEKAIIIKVQAATPVITLAREAGRTTVTIEGTSEGTTVYYNYTGSTVITESKAYTEPIELTYPATIYAFADGGDFLTSEVAKQVVDIDGLDVSSLRQNIAGHFDANADNWKGKGQQTDGDGNIINANYFFTWGKNAGSYWDESSAETVKASDGVSDSIIYTRTLDPETYEADGWRIKSVGQVMVWESLSIGYNIGDGNMRNPDTAEDAIGVNDSIGITVNAITFGKQPSDGPFNASLESTTKYQAPFDVVVYAGNGNDGEIPTMQVEVSADGENWTKIGDVAYSLIKRNWKKTRLSYEGTDEVYVRILHTKAKSSGQIYDLYVMDNAQSVLKGDINGDGSVNGLDIQSIINACADALTDAKYDVNDDGEVNGMDIQTVIIMASEGARRMGLVLE